MATFDFVVAKSNQTIRSNENDKITGRDLFENVDALKKIICLSNGFEPSEPFPLCQGGQQQGMLKFVYTHIPIRIIMITFGPCLLYGIPIVMLTLIYNLIRFMMRGIISITKKKAKHD